MEMTKLKDNNWDFNQLPVGKSRWSTIAKVNFIPVYQDAAFIVLIHMNQKMFSNYICVYDIFFTEKQKLPIFLAFKTSKILGFEMEILLYKSCL